ncbi:phosphoribosylformylglycinamidine synthase PurL [Bifidobacterium bifidum]|nr:phosphoribosylformylglycinamidine synthase PurL [Bifidobacterium bifidum]
MKRATSPEFKGDDHRIVRIAPRYLADGLTPDKDALLEAFSVIEELTDFHRCLGRLHAGLWRHRRSPVQDDARQPHWRDPERQHRRG